MSEIINALVEMGFDRKKAELACATINPENVSDAMDWILSHEDALDNATETSEPVVAIPTPSTEETQASDDTVEATEQVDSPQVAKSIKCTDCGKLFKNQTEIEFHATKSGHENFSESMEEKKPLTEDEKKEQLAKIEAKLKQRRLEREAREKQEELEREKNRIRSGKEILEAKKKHEELEIKKLVEQKKKEKEEERIARQRVKDQIEQDKLMRKAKFGGGGQIETPTIIRQEEQEQAKPSTQPIDYSEVKLHIRLTDGNSLNHTFSAKEPLSAVRLYIEMHRTDAPGSGIFGLMTSYPRKVFTSEDYEKPLNSLGLAPSAVIIVTKS